MGWERQCEGGAQPKGLEKAGHCCPKRSEKGLQRMSDGEDVDRLKSWGGDEAKCEDEWD